MTENGGRAVAARARQIDEQKVRGTAMRAPEVAGPALIRDINERLVIRSMRDGRPMRVSEVQSATALSRATTASILVSLEQRRWIVAHDATVTGRGRPARLFTFNAAAGAVVGVDVGAYSLRCVVADLTGRELGRAELPADPGMAQQVRWTTARAALNQALGIAGLTPEDVWATMIAATGTVDPVTSRVERSSALPGLAGSVLSDVARPHLPGLLFAENDVRAATWAEQTAGVARGSGVLLHLVLGRRPAIGVTIDGSLFRGAHLVSGDLDRSGLDSVLDGRSPLPPELAGAPDPLRALLIAASTAEPWAIDITAAYADRLGPSLALISTTIDPEAIVIGGPLGVAGEPVRAALERAVHSMSHAKPRVLLSSFDRFVSARGASLMAAAEVEKLLLGTDGGPLPDLVGLRFDSR